MIKSHRSILSIAALLVFMLTLPITVSAADDISAKSCDEKAALVNYRSELLAIYKKNENKRYDVFRKKWTARISYAGQWVPKEAHEAEQQLYKYDALRTISNRELDKQIKDNLYLQDKPLECSSADKAALAKKIDEVHGLKDGKAASGTALINYYKRQEVKLRGGNFKMTSDKMIRQLHKAKDKHPKPEHSRISVKEYQD